MQSILDVFCAVDDFWQLFAPQWQMTCVTGKGLHRRRVGQRHPSAIRTILMAFHHSHYRTFKASCQIEHARQRSPTNFLVHLIRGLVAYCHLPQKPSLPLVGQPTLAA